MGDATSMELILRYLSADTEAQSLLFYMDETEEGGRMHIILIL